MNSDSPQSTTAAFDRDQLVRGCAALDVAVTTEQIDTMLRYCALLDTRNQELNLTGHAPEKFITHHLLDSLALARVIDVQSVVSVADIGTGAGLPGIPLAIVYPHLKITLIDSTRKKLKFVDEVLSELSIDNACSIHERAEALASDPRYLRGFDCVVARAVAPLEKLVQWMLPLVSKNGLAVAYKGPSVRDEFLQMQSSGKDANISVDLRDVVVPELNADRTMVLIRHAT